MRHSLLFLFHYDQDRHSADENYGAVLSIRRVDQRDIWRYEPDGRDENTWRSHLRPWSVRLTNHPAIQLSQPIKVVLRVGGEHGPLLRRGGPGIIQGAHDSFNVGAVLVFARESK